MAIELRIIRSVDYLDISDDGTINFSESKKKLKEIARNEASDESEVLLDFRRTQWILSTDEIYDLVEVLVDEKDVFSEKIALLLLPGVNFDSAYFKELCNSNKGVSIKTFTNYEDAVQWFYN